MISYKNMPSEYKPHYPNLELKPGTSLTMTPMMQQAVNLLAMTAVELNDEINSEIEKNPFLEKESDFENGSDEVSSKLNGMDKIDEFDGRSEQKNLLDNIDDKDYVEHQDSEEDAFYEQSNFKDSYRENDFSVDTWSGVGSSNYNDEDFDLIDNCLAPKESLYEFVERQIRNRFKEKEDLDLAFSVYDELDENGYVYSELTPDQEMILPYLQKFEPVGIFSRNLSECIKLQLKSKKQFDRSVEIILDNLNLVAQKEYVKLAKTAGISQEVLAEKIKLIKKCYPRPADGYDAGNVELASVVVPDVFVRKTKNGEFVVELNQSTLPHVLVNQNYASEVLSISKDKTVKKFVSENMSKANFLIQALHQRAKSILSIATQIVEDQKEFFEKGKQALKPMIMKDVAEKVELSESTISRIVNGKYLMCSFGTFELKFFFTNGLSSNQTGELCSVVAIKEKIADLINKESVEHILSDDNIVSILEKDGISIARRTVAKYREAMNIPTSAVRKRDKRLKI
ncbi:MAG: RNA polymerase factor sigma-54 [Alphaproteobacteria bacterium]|nr:RNA polymerase factor sigma-54 [Alphaproteobacteria bacterium]